MAPNLSLLGALAGEDVALTWLEPLVDPRGRAGEPLAIAATSAARSSGFPRLLRAGDRLVLAWVEDGARDGGAGGAGELTRLRAGSLPFAAVPAAGQ
jgi:hypothetical protein